MSNTLNFKHYCRFSNERLPQFVISTLIYRIEKGLEKEGVLEFLENLAKLITPEYIDALYLKTYQILEEMGYTTDKLMFELMQPCNQMIKSCAWLGKIIPCDTIFRVAKSSEGFCCSFNYKSLKEFTSGTSRILLQTTCIQLSVSFSRCFCGNKKINSPQ